jgi:hypothetical protein
VPKYKGQKTVRRSSNFYDSFFLKYSFQFALQMLHDNMIISAGGFFTVDMHLFFSVNLAILKPTDLF